jgi:hypothetical protein
METGTETKRGGPGSGTKTVERLSVRCQYPVFNRDIPLFIPFFSQSGIQLRLSPPSSSSSSNPPVLPSRSRPAVLLGCSCLGAPRRLEPRQPSEPPRPRRPEPPPRPMLMSCSLLMSRPLLMSRLPSWATRLCCRRRCCSL